MNQTMDFTNKVVMITGGSSGIGRATALAFARQGAAVSIGSTNDKEGEETVRLIENVGGRSIFINTDVTQASEVENLVNETFSTFNGLDCAFNNAGALPPTEALVDVDEATFDKIISVDLKGVFLCLKYEIRQMLKENKGDYAIVNTSSVAGVIADPGMSPYVAAKHGVIGLTRSAALDYAKKNIRINAIAPGLIATGMTKRWLKDSQIRNSLLANSPIGRAGQPEEVSGMVMFLCSQASSFATGGVYLIDGGQTIH